MSFSLLRLVLAAIFNMSRECPYKDRNANTCVCVCVYKKSDIWLKGQYSLPGGFILTQIEMAI